MGNMKVYYAHCKAIYNTPLEQRDIKLLQSLGFEVDNPNDDKHKIGWTKYKMKYADKVVPKANLVAFRSLPDGTIPAGVAYELNIAYAKDIPVIELPHFHGRKVLNVEETRRYIREIGQR